MTKRLDERSRLRFAPVFIAIGAGVLACAARKSPVVAPREPLPDWTACRTASECVGVIASCASSESCDEQGAVWMVSAHYRDDAEHAVYARCGGKGQCTAYPIQAFQHVAACQSGRCGVALERLRHTPHHPRERVDETEFEFEVEDAGGPDGGP